MDFRDAGQGADDMTAMMTDMLEKVATEAVKVEAETKPADDKKRCRANPSTNAVSTL